jgi:hypothetical protein
MTIEPTNAVRSCLNGKKEDRNLSIEASLNACVRASVYLLGYKFLPGTSEDDLRFSLIVKSGKSYRAQVLIYEDMKAATLSVFLTDDMYHASQKKAVFELGHRVSELLVFGGICVQAESGAILYTHGFDAGAIAPSPASISRWLNQSAFPVALFEKAYNRLKADQAGAYSALKAAQIELGADDHHGVFDDTRRVLLRMTPGGKSLNSRSPSITGEVERNLDVLINELKKPNLFLNPS